MERKTLSGIWSCNMQWQSVFHFYYPWSRNRTLSAPLFLLRQGQSFTWHAVWHRMKRSRNSVVVWEDWRQSEKDSLCKICIAWSMCLWVAVRLTLYRLLTDFLGQTLRRAGPPLKLQHKQTQCGNVVLWQTGRKDSCALFCRRHWAGRVLHLYVRLWNCGLIFFVCLLRYFNGRV